MSLYTLVDWSLVVLAFGLMTTGVGIVLGKVFTLLERVADLEAWASEVSYELVAQEQRRDVELLRERMQDVENGLAQFGCLPPDSSEAAA